MKKIKISVITVVKNGMPFLKNSIKSFNNQSLLEKEHIIVYSPSTDNTENYLRFLKGKKIIRDIKSKNKFGSLNLGIKEAKGELVGILHADDIYPDKHTLKNIYDFYKKNKSDLIYGNIKFSSKNNLKKIVRIWKSDNFKYDKLKFGWMPPHTSIYVIGKLIKKNPYSINFPISGDYKFILDLFLNNKIKKKFFNRVLCIMRSGGDSTKLSRFFQKLNEDIQISKLFFKHFYVTVFLKILRKSNQFFIN